MTIGANDVWQISQTLTIAGPGIGSLVALALAAVLLLSISIWLGAVVLAGVALLGGVVAPLVGRLQGRQDQYRAQDARVSIMASDLVLGLRVLNGVGGKTWFRRRYQDEAETLRATGYRVGTVTSWIAALATGAPVLFLAAIMWLAARLTLDGEITVGQLLAVYGYVAILIVPIAFFIEGGNDLGRGLVASRRLLAFLSLTPVAAAGDQAGASLSRSEDGLVDPLSGLRIRPRGLVVLMFDRHADTLQVADRLAGRVPSDVRLNGVQLSAMPRDELRQHILIGDQDAHVFAGTLREIIAAGDEPDAFAALHEAAADDILSLLPEGLDAPIQSQARNLSGGQAQRIRLARCLARRAPVLILIEPTSAVDAPTEALIVERVAQERETQSTIVITSSARWADRANEVVVLGGGRIVAAGGHRSLLESVPGYRARFSTAPTQSILSGGSVR